MQPLQEGLLKKIPEFPGIYFMKDKNGEILYIGKAKSLKTRVRSYFHQSELLLPRTRVMVKKIADIDCIIASNEIEALILESNFIKQCQPRYNVLLKDDKHYPFIRLSTSTSFPFLSIVRKVNKDGATYMGPYAMVKEVRETLKLAQKIFPIRQSRDDLDGKFKRRPCLNFQIGNCAAPCAGKITREDYNKIIQDVILFLKGKNDTLLEYLKKRMSQASEELRYEEAAKLRDQIMAVESVIKKQKIISIKQENQDIIAFYRRANSANVQILMVRKGKMIGDKSYKLKNLEGVGNDELLSSFIKQYYADGFFIPEEILLSMNVSEKTIIRQWLAGIKKSKVNICVPEKGRKKSLVKMAEENAGFAYKKEESNQTILEELKEIMSLRNTPLRIEAFDISCIAGGMAVGASVLFLQGQPFKKGYRRYKIRQIKGADDYGMISQIVFRHYARLLEEQKDLPDLIIIDGGKGHLNVACKTLQRLNLLEKIDIIAISKGNERNRLETDEVYTLKHKGFVSFPAGSPIKFFIQRVRDEAHRFAINYHRLLRKKGGLQSALDAINGVGEKRKKQLLKHFGSMAKLRKATVDEIKKAPLITEKIAQEIKTRI